MAIKVNLEVSSFVREVISKSGSLADQIGTRGACTVLRLKDGETQILAGLISDKDRSSTNKVPGLGEMPVAGRLFGSQKDDSQRSEILLSITPRVVRSVRRPDLQSAEFESGTESNIGARPLQLTGGAAEVLKTVTPVPAAGGAVVPGADAASAVAPVNAGTAPAAPAAKAAPAQKGALAKGAVNLSWKAPAQVKVGRAVQRGAERQQPAGAVGHAGARKPRHRREQSRNRWLAPERYIESDHQAIAVQARALKASTDEGTVRNIRCRERRLRGATRRRTSEPFTRCASGVGNVRSTRASSWRCAALRAFPPAWSKAMPRIAACPQADGFPRLGDVLVDGQWRVVGAQKGALLEKDAQHIAFRNYRDKALNGVGLAHRYRVEGDMEFSV